MLPKVARAFIWFLCWRHFHCVKETHDRNYFPGMHDSAVVATWATGVTSRNLHASSMHVVSMKTLWVFDRLCVVMMMFWICCSLGSFTSSATCIHFWVHILPEVIQQQGLICICGLGVVSWCPASKWSRLLFRDAGALAMDSVGRVFQSSCRVGARELCISPFGALFGQYWDVGVFHYLPGWFAFWWQTERPRLGLRYDFG